jgi:hypothetical protein
MRYMLIVKANKDSEAGVMPPRELIDAMQKYNEGLVQAGVLLSGDGLQASSQGARIQFKPGHKPTVVDGPFAEMKELIAGFWMLDVASKDEAIAWALKAPAPHGPDHPAELELRRVFDSEDFGPEVAANEQALRNEIAKRTRK